MQWETWLVVRLIVSRERSGLPLANSHDDNSGAHNCLATKPGVILINVARGDLIDSMALTSALQQGHVSAAALDVFAPEPIPHDHPILKMDQVIVSPHIASTSVQAACKLRTTVAAIVASALRGERLPNVVNGVSLREP
jgi:phosphoglycerate dehydrogenase-like enzyme